VEQLTPSRRRIVLANKRVPNAQPFVERFVGSARRECFDHVIVFNEAGLKRLMTFYCSYFERSRTHLPLHKDTPIPRPVMPPGDGTIVAIPELGGLHHRYERRCRAQRTDGARHSGPRGNVLTGDAERAVPGIAASAPKAWTAGLHSVTLNHRRSPPISKRFATVLIERVI
jgi:hypothetical protein